MLTAARAERGHSGIADICAKVPKLIDQGHRFAQLRGNVERAVIEQRLKPGNELNLRYVVIAAAALPIAALAHAAGDDHGRGVQ